MKIKELRTFSPRIAGAKISFLTFLIKYDKKNKFKRLDKISKFMIKLLKIWNSNESRCQIGRVLQN
ncbi:MAG: hypothetical protein AB1414_15040 [bacterium]